MRQRSAPDHDLGDGQQLKLYVNGGCHLGSNIAYGSAQMRAGAPITILTASRGEFSLAIGDLTATTRFITKTSMFN